MKRLSTYVLTFILALCTGTVFASSNIAVVDVQKIMQQSPEMSAIKTKLEGQFKSRRDKLMTMDADLKKMMEKYKKDAAVMSSADKKSMEQKMMTEQRALEQQGQEYQKDLNTAHNQAMQSLYEKVKKAVADVAAKEKFDLVLQKEAATFAQEKLDITDKVQEKLK